MKLTPVANAITAAATRLGMTLSTQVNSMAAAAITSPIVLAVEIGNWILRLAKSDAVSANDGANVLNELFVSFFKSKTDQVGLAEAIALDFHKALTESAGLTDAQIISLFKLLVEQASVADHAQVTFAKHLVDSLTVTDDVDGTATIADDQTIAFVKSRTEVLVLQELVEIVMAYVRSYEDQTAVSDLFQVGFARSAADAFEVSDEVVHVAQKVLSDFGLLTDGDVTFDTGKVLEELPVASDALSKELTRAPILEAFAVSDPMAITIGPVKQDSALITDTGSLRSQGYCDLSYFEEDYVGAIRNF